MSPRALRCTRCRGRAEVQLRAHNAAFCRGCFVFYFRRQVERTIARERMITRGERVLVAVSGGKDSLALWEVLAELGYKPTGLHLALGIGAYSEVSRRRTEDFARAQGLPLEVIDLSRQQPDLGVDTVVAHTRRSACAACGILKRHFFDQAARAGNYDVLATGHNLDDEAARLLGNVLHWRVDHLGRQRPVLEPNHPKFVRKVKPLYLLSEFETAAYAFVRGIDYVVEECPNAAGATELVCKDALNRLEAEMPGTKQAFVKEFRRAGIQDLFAERTAAAGPPRDCPGCGMPAYGELCAFCSLVGEVGNKRGRREGPAANGPSAAPAAAG